MVLFAKAPAFEIVADLDFAAHKTEDIIHALLCQSIVETDGSVLIGIPVYGDNPDFFVVCNPVLQFVVFYFFKVGFVAVEIYGEIFLGGDSQRQQAKNDQGGKFHFANIDYRKLRKNCFFRYPNIDNLRIGGKTKNLLRKKQVFLYPKGKLLSEQQFPVFGQCPDFIVNQ
jgi:hypothetical protein